MKTHVLYLTPYPPTRSGIADYAARFKEVIEKAGPWRLTVVPFDGLPANSPADLQRIYRSVLAWRSRWPDAALVHAEIGCRQHAAFYSLDFLRRLIPEISYVVTVHDPPLVIAPALFPLALGTERQLVRRALRVLDYTPLARAVLRRPLRHASQLFALTKVGTASLRKVVGDAVPVDYLPQVSPTDHPSPRRRPTRLGEPVKILFLGFWGPRTGLPVLLRALERLVSDNRSRVKLLLAGGADQSRASRTFVEGICSEIDRSRVREWIEVLGFVPADRLETVFEEADIFVLPYTSQRTLSASAVGLRAAAAGLPIVASGLRATSEHVIHLKTGLVVPAGNARALAEALGRLVGDPDLRYRLGRAAQSHVRRSHSAAAVASKVLPIYERLSLRGASAAKNPRPLPEEP
jgi:glycosyltransferase involved in cell wall biosynthesis